jgi:hypothetical protein
VIREGVEPSTYALEGRCSIQLSYRIIFLLYSGRDLNPQGHNVHWSLSPARLPISPPEYFLSYQYVNELILLFTIFIPIALSLFQKKESLSETLFHDSVVLTLHKESL